MTGDEAINIIKGNINKLNGTMQQAVMTMMEEGEKNQAVKEVLEKRRAILKKAIEIRKLDSCPNDKWLDGKYSGYSDALYLLRSTVESIRIEL